MNLSKFTKVHADDKMSVLKHADGHELRIAHAGLKPALRKKLEAMPMADGGEVQKKGLADLPEALGKMFSFEGSANAAEPVASPAVPAMEKPAVETLAPEAARAPAAVSTEQPQDKFGLEAMQQAQLSGLEKQRQAAGLTAQALTETGEAQAKRLDEYAQQMAKDEETYKTERGRLDKEAEATIADIQAGHIDPRHYINNMSTGSKIMTGIGLILGGMGAGLTGQPNLVAQFLQKQIDNDLEAQKSEIGKKQNLLSHNYQATQNLRSAYDLTRMQTNDIISAQLKAEAARTQNVQAQAALLAESGKLDMQSAQLRHNMALQKMMLGGAGGDSEQAFKQQTQFLRMSGQEGMAKDMEAKHVPGVGQASMEVPNDARKEMTGRQDLQNKLADLQAFSEKHGGSLEPSIIAEGKAKAALVQDAYRRANAQGVFKESEKDFVESIIHSDPTQFFAKYRSQRGYQQAMRDNQDALNTLKSSYGLPTKEAPQYKIVNGVKYMRGPDGRAIPVK